MKRTLGFLVVVGLTSCGDGPKDIFKPNGGDPKSQNGYSPRAPYTPLGTKEFDTAGVAGDSNQRAKFCDSAENEALIRDMVVKPIIPDTSAGGVPLWTPAGVVPHADDLQGKLADGKFCDPDIYSNALTWGPTNEIIVFINTETKALEAIAVTAQYLGTLSGSYKPTGDAVPVTIKMRSKIKVGDKELTDFATVADQANKPNAFTNHTNITNIYRMIRETFFNVPAGQIPANFDCVANAVCDVIYSVPNSTQPNEVDIVFRDSGVTLLLQPDGVVGALIIEPVRVAPFEASATVATTNAGSVAGLITSLSKPGCNIGLGTDMTFSAFKTSCVDDRALNRANYSVHTARDAVDVEFNGFTITFAQQMARGNALADGSRPSATDKVLAFSFSRSFKGAAAEFVPATLAQTYKARLEARLQALVASDATHPFRTYSVTLPTLSQTPQAIGELVYNGPSGRVSLIPKIIDDLKAAYTTLTPAQKALAAPANDPLYLVEPFVDTVLDAFSLGKGATGDGVKLFTTTDDRRWSIGYAYFGQGASKVRVNVQYSLFYHALTFVHVQQGTNKIDDFLFTANTRLRGANAATQPYYDLDVADTLIDENADPNLTSQLVLGSKYLKVLGYDRKLSTVDVKFGSGNTSATNSLTVPGVSINDRGGFSRQLRGERYEFVPATSVGLNGKNQSFTFYVEADGTVGRIVTSTFKRPFTLCPGLTVNYGDDIRSAVDAYFKANPLEYGQCELVFNYSFNGNVLQGVASIANKREVLTTNGRINGAAIWQ